MAITLELLAPTGLTLTVDLYPYGSDTRANGSGDALVEATNRKGLYTATIAEAITGWHTAHVLLSETVIAVGDVYLVAGSTCRVRDASPSQSRANVVPSGGVDPEWADCYVDVYDEDGELEAGVVCSLRIVKEPSGSGQIFGGTAVEATSDANGRVCWPKRPVGCQIEYWRGGADADPKRIKRATIAAVDVVDGVFWLPRIVGHEDLTE